MKNPLTYFKHIVKDPITTVAGADAGKKGNYALVLRLVGGYGIGHFFGCVSFLRGLLSDF